MLFKIGILGCYFNFLLFVSIAIADTKIFTREYTYQASEADSKISSRAIALEQVKRLLLEEVGTYMLSETVVKNYELTKDQAVTLTAGVVQSKVVKETWDGARYWLKAEVEVEPGEMAKAIDELHKDKDKSRELEELRKRTNDALADINRLRNELKISSDSRELIEYSSALDKLSAEDWFSKGVLNDNLGKWNEAIKAYSNAIGLNPKLVRAYNNRGCAFSKLGDYNAAVRDFDKTIELEPQSGVAYYNRGISKGMEGTYHDAIKDFDKAIVLNTRIKTAYYNRGVTYERLGVQDRFIEDLTYAAKLGLKEAQDVLRAKGIGW